MNIFNLLSNPIKYFHPDRSPRVQLRAARLRDTLVLCVQDNGVSLDETQQSRLFSLFQCLHTHVEGSGVDLYLVKQSVENPSGSVAVQSQSGIGSTFTVTLPDAVDDPATSSSELS